MEEKKTIWKVKDPIQCQLWSMEKITGDDLDFTHVQTYVDTSHFSRSLLRCKECGQLYYSEFYEIVDWENGNDDIYSTYIPIEYDEGVINELNNRSPFELLGVYPKLQWDNDEPIKWSR